MENLKSSEPEEKPRTPAKNIPRLLQWKLFENSDLVIYKLFCLLLYGSYGSLYPYLPLYFKQLGLGANQAGLIVGIRPVVQCLGAPFWGTLADRYKAGRIILMGGIMAWIVKAFLILAVRPNNQQCILVYVNKSGNESETLIYVNNLWKLNEGKEKWVTVPLVKKPVIIQKNKLVHVGHGLQFKHVNLKTTNVPTTKQANVATRTEKAYQNFKSLSKEAELVHNIVNRGLGPYGASHETGTDNDHEQVQLQRKKRSLSAGKALSNSSSRFTENYHIIKHGENQVAKTKQFLMAIGKVITSSVKKYDRSLNSTVVYVTQLDISELYHLFVIFTLFIVIGEFLESPTYTLSDSSLLKALGEHVEKYGHVRMFGSLGAGIAVVVVGAIVYTSRFELCGTIQQNYMAAFYIYIALTSGAFFTVLGFTFEYSDESVAEPAFKEAAKLLLRPRRLSFIVTAWFAGMCFGFLFHYVNWFIDDINGHAITMGVAGGVREFSGILVFFFAGGLLKLIGHVNCLACGIIAYASIMFSYSVLTVPWFAVALEAFSGGTYAIAWSTCIGYFNTVGRSVKNPSSLQGILQGVFWGLGNGGGTVIGGSLYHKFGPQITFRAFGIAGLVVLVLFVIVQRFCCVGEEDNENEPEPGYEAVASEEKEEGDGEKDKNESTQLQTEKAVGEGKQ